MVVAWLALELQCRAQTFTVGSTNRINWDGSTRGQGFISDVPGPQGTGNSGSSTTVYLNQFTVYFTDGIDLGSIFQPPPAFVPPPGFALRIYSSLPTIAELNVGTGMGLLGSSTNLSGRTFVFDSLPLARTTQYYALLSADAWVEYNATLSSSNLYGRGLLYYNQANVLSVAPSDVNMAFIASFSQSPLTQTVAPTVAVQRDLDRVLIKWSTSYTNFVLQKTSSLTDSNSWVPVVTNSPVLGEEFVYTNLNVGSGVFFRLKRP